MPENRPPADSGGLECAYQTGVRARVQGESQRSSCYAPTFLVPGAAKVVPETPDVVHVALADDNDVLFIAADVPWDVGLGDAVHRRTPCATHISCRQVEEK